MLFPIDSGEVAVQVSRIDPVEIAADRSDLLRLGARPDSLDRAPGLLLARSGLPDGVLEQWFVVRASVTYGSLSYNVTLFASPGNPEDSPFLEGKYSAMLATWQWTGKP
jgi:hypothetical protein